MPRNHINMVRRSPNRQTVPDNDDSYCQNGPAYFNGFENGSRRSFAFSASLLGAAILIGFAITCASDLRTSKEQFEDMKADILHLKNILESLTKNVQEIVPEIRTTKRIEEIMTEMRDCLPHLCQSTNKLKEYVHQEISEKASLILSSLSEAMKPMQDVIDNGVFAADGTGKVDFALESTGGKVVNIRNTEPYIQDSMHSFFGKHLCEKGNPKAIIQPEVLPGQCWAFKGSSGSAVIQLIGYVHISSVTMEHIPVVLSPTENIASAPRDFSIWGLKSEDDNEGFFFGQFTYDKLGPAKQRFEMQHRSNEPYPYVELKVLSNHGEERYTCIYRLRVHGKLFSFISPHVENRESRF